jgi:hypothetical protein
VSTALGLDVSPPPRQGEPHEAAWDLVERRERCARKHPEVMITARRVAGTLLFDVSAPSFVAVGYDSAATMMADLESRYPA